MTKNRDIHAGGLVPFERRGIKPAPLSDLYHFLLSTRWSYFLLLLIGGYLFLNSCFALLYALDPQGISQTKSGTPLQYFFFAIETFSTVGYGGMSPQSPYSHWLMVVQSLTGFIYTALSTGLIFAKFSRLRGRVLFSENALIHMDNREAVLTFRAANQRSSQVVDATLKLCLARDETTHEGVFARRIYDLPLRRNNTPLFALAWNVYHPITPESPLYKITPEELAQQRISLFVTFSGIDDSLSTVLHDRCVYDYKQIRFDLRFKDIIGLNDDGSRFIEYNDFHALRPMPDEFKLNW